MVETTREGTERDMQEIQATRQQHDVSPLNEKPVVQESGAAPAAQQGLAPGTTPREHSPQGQDQISALPPVSSPNENNANASTQTAAAVPPTVRPIPDTPSYLKQLKDGEHAGLWKLGIRIFLVVIALIGIGCIAGCVEPNFNDWNFSDDNSWSIIWGLITFGVTVLWCMICILVYLLRKRPAHPGIAVGMDLILWIGYIVTALLITFAVLNISDFSTAQMISYFDDSNGNYVLDSSDNWIWNQTSYHFTYDGNNTSRDCDGSSSSSGSSSYYGYYSYSYMSFANCAEQDAYVNKLWDERSRKRGLQATAATFQWLAVLLHFVLFVWACVDTHRRRRGKTSLEAQKLASQIVSSIVQNGQFIHPPNAAYQPNGAYRSLNTPTGRGVPQQQWQQFPMQNLSPQQQQQQRQSMGPQWPLGPAQAAPTEKGGLPYYR